MFKIKLFVIIEIFSEKIQKLKKKASTSDS